MLGPPPSPTRPRRRRPQQPSRPSHRRRRPAQAPPSLTVGAVTIRYPPRHRHPLCHPLCRAHHLLYRERWMIWQGNDNN